MDSYGHFMYDLECLWRDFASPSGFLKELWNHRN